LRDACGRCGLPGYLSFVPGVVMAINPAFFEIDLPLAPPANNLYAVYRGRKILSEEGREYKSKVEKILSNGFTYQLIPPKTNLCFAAIFYIPKGSFYRRDLDGCLKCTIDSIFQAFKAMGGQANDNRITEILASKRLAEPEDLKGFCSVTLSLADEGI
jgi:Holliday junction resolvase RusA-like endonuclease